MLRQWLQAGYVENRTLFPTAAGLRSGLSRVRGKLSCTVLTGGGGGNVAPLPDQCLETKAKFIAQVTGESDLRRIEDIDGAALTYAEVKAKPPPNSMPTDQRNRRQLLPNLIL